MTPLLQTTIDLNSAGSGNLPGATGGTQAQNFFSLVSNVISAIMVVAGLLLLLYLLWGAIEWLTSGGDQSKVQSARNRITQAVIGIIVLAASLALYEVVAVFLGIESLIGIA